MLISQQALCPYPVFMLASVALASYAPYFQHLTTGNTFSGETHLSFPVIFHMAKSGYLVADFALVKELFNLILLCNLVHF